MVGAFSLPQLLAAAAPGGGALPVVYMIAAGIAAYFLFTTIIIAKNYRKAGPNQVLIISGRRHMVRMPDGSIGHRGFRIARGGGAFVWPMLETMQVLSLECVPVALEVGEVQTSEGATLKLVANGQVMIGADDKHIVNAATRLLSLSREEIGQAAAPIFEQQIRRSIGSMSADEVGRCAQALADAVRKAAEPELGQLGLVCNTFVISAVRNADGTPVRSTPKAEPITAV